MIKYQIGLDNGTVLTIAADRYSVRRGALRLHAYGKGEVARIKNWLFIGEAGA